ncbi:amidohydrolase [candidate division WOR-3 bacterium]|nr:amidohydrolase [candidate division WOR-3 bacterium]
MKLTGQVLVDAWAEPRPATLVFTKTVEAILDTPTESRTGVLSHRSFRTSSPPAVIVPGLIDSHTHPLEAGLEQLFPDLRHAASVSEVQERLRARRTEAREQGILLGFNLEPERLREQRYPSRQELDAAVSEAPLLVYRVDGHSAVTNTAGLKALHSPCRPSPLVGANSPPRPAIGETEEETGVLRGETYERASRWFKHKLRPETIQEALRLFGERAATQGVTTFGALVGVEDSSDAEWQVFLDALAALPIRAVPYLQTWNLEVPRRFGLKQSGGCLLIDGSFGSRTAALNQEYADAPGNLGASYVSDQRLVGFLQAANVLGLQTAVHAIGDRAVEQVVRCHEYVSGQGPRNPLRHRIEHAELQSDNLIGRISGLGLVLGVQPAFEAEWGGPHRLYAQRLGERWRRTNPYRHLLDSAVVLAGGSDAPITPVCPLAGIRAATAHPNQDEALTGKQALAMFTSAAAFALKREQTSGSLEPGKDADFTVLNADPRVRPDCQVLATFCAGERLYGEKELEKHLTLED